MKQYKSKVEDNSSAIMDKNIFVDPFKDNALNKRTKSA